MNRLIESVMQRATIILVFVLLTEHPAWDGFSCSNAKDYLPSINNTTLMVSLRASSLQADQIGRDITAPLEDAIRRTNGLTNLDDLL